MRRSYRELLTHIVIKFLFDAKFYDLCEANGVGPLKWPECDLTIIANKYAEARKKHSHNYATVLVSDEVEKIESTQEFTDDNELLFEAFRKEDKQYRLDDLIKKLQMDPKNSDAHLFNYNTKQSDGVERVDMRAVFEQTWKNAVKTAQEKRSVIVIPGWEKLSESIGGFNPGRTSMLMAETGFGKTTLSLNLSLQAAKRMRCLYFNMEMSKQDFAEKILLAKTKTPFTTLKHNPQSMNDAMSAVALEVYDSKLLFTTGKTLSVEQIISVTRSESQNASEGPLELVVVDYDQKLDMKTTRDVPEWKALQLAVESLEQLAKDVNCHVMILAQQGREGEISGSRRSTFPASTVMKFYKEEQINKVLIEVVKNRFGRRGVCIEVNYEPEKSIAREVGQYDKQPTGSLFGDVQRRTPYKSRQIKDD
jgi:hypothetical protein